MRTRRLGSHGLEVSELGLGTLTWGRDTDQAEARRMLATFVDAGGSLVDVAPTHGDGLATGVLGSILGDVGRERCVLAVRGGARRATPDAPPVRSTARGDMLDSLDRSLADLGTDHVDVWLADGPGAGVPLGETLSALETARASGRARYVGLSNYSAWSTGLALGAARAAGSDLDAIEAEYSLLQRGADQELLPGAVAAGLGVLAFAPLARGVLTGKYRRTTPPDSRAASVHLRHLVDPYLDADHAGIVEACAKAAEGLDLSPAAVALAWVRDAPGVSAAVVGPRTARQLELIVGTLEVALPRAIRQALDDVSRVRRVYPAVPPPGFRSARTAP